MNKTTIIYDITYSGVHARGLFKGERFGGKGHMTLPDGREYIYARMPLKERRAWQLIEPLSLAIKIEPFIDDSMNDKFPDEKPRLKYEVKMKPNLVKNYGKK